MATKKNIKASKENKIDFSDSLKSVKDTASTLQSKVKKTAKVLVEDLKENGKQLTDNATSTAKKAYQNLSETDITGSIAQTAKKANEFALQTADQTLDGVEHNGEKWADISQKAIKGGAKLASKQQEIMFDTIEAMREQLSIGGARFQKLFPFATRKNLVRTTEKSIQKVKEEVREMVPQAKAKVNGAIKKAKEVSIDDLI